ncbi:MAG: nucleotidyltransferase domain-containing protein [Nitrososphaerota archaeon]|nr:nucleotidyltransferase domain-containing protein [Nitrososphaerota archaeon]
MSSDILIKAALKRRNAFKNLPEKLETIKRVVKKLDPEAQTYLFGSVAQQTHTYSSDIDILVVTRLPPAKIHAELWKAQIGEPFEIHVQTPEKARFYMARTKLVEI